MRVLHVVSTLAPTSGGPTEVLKQLPVAQTLAGHRVTVCTTNRGNPPHEKLPAAYFNTLYPDDVALQVFSVGFTPLMFSVGLARWLRRNAHDFDLVHIHGLYRFPPTYAAFQARRQAIPYIIRPHGSLDPYLYARSSRSLLLKRAYERWFDFPNLNAASAIHYTAEEERDRAASLNLQAPSFVIPNGIDWERFRTLPPRGALRARWGLHDEPLVLFLGRIHFKKGLDLLIPAFDSLRRRLPAAQLVIAGPENDDYGQKVRAWVRERSLDASVHFVGLLSGPDVVQAYVDADVFALPSYTENFGMTVAESMACALPVVISDQVNIHAEVAGAGAGLVTRCDSDEIAEALLALLGDDDRRRNMGQAGRRLVQERYTWPPIVEALTREYEAAIARTRAAPTGGPRHSQPDPEGPQARAHPRRTGTAPRLLPPPHGGGHRTSTDAPDARRGSHRRRHRRQPWPVRPRRPVRVPPRAHRLLRAPAGASRRLSLRVLRRSAAPHSTKPPSAPRPAPPPSTFPG